MLSKDSSVPRNAEDILDLLATETASVLPRDTDDLIREPSGFMLRLAQAFLMAVLLGKNAGVGIGDRVEDAVDLWSGMLFQQEIRGLLLRSPGASRVPLGRCLALCGALRDPSVTVPAVAQWAAATSEATPRGSNRSVFSDLECQWLRAQLGVGEFGQFASRLHGYWQHPVHMSGSDFDFMTHSLWYATDFGARPVNGLDESVNDAVVTAVLWSWHSLPGRVEALLAASCLGGSMPAWLTCAVTQTLAAVRELHDRKPLDRHWLSRLALFECGLTYAGHFSICNHADGDHEPFEVLSTVVFDLVDALRSADQRAADNAADAYRGLFGETPTWLLARNQVRWLAAR
jgi:hypothetical protein